MKFPTYTKYTLENKTQIITAENGRIISVKKEDSLLFIPAKGILPEYIVGSRKHNYRMLSNPPKKNEYLAKSSIPFVYNCTIDSKVKDIEEIDIY